MLVAIGADEVPGHEAQVRVEGVRGDGLGDGVDAAGIDVGVALADKAAEVGDRGGITAFGVRAEGISKGKRRTFYRPGEIKMKGAGAERQRRVVRNRFGNAAMVVVVVVAREGQRGCKQSAAERHAAARRSGGSDKTTTRKHPRKKEFLFHVFSPQKEMETEWPRF